MSERPTADFNAITPDYLRTVGMRLFRGRDFNEADTLEAPGVVLVNESFARRFFPNGDPLGQHATMVSAPGSLDARDVRGLPEWSEIAGVISDVKSLSAQPEAVPEIYRPFWQWPVQNPTVFVRATVDASALGAAIRRETKSVIPNLPAPKIRLLTDPSTFVAASLLLVCVALLACWFPARRTASVPPMEALRCD